MTDSKAADSLTFLMAENAIRQLIARYAHAVDEGRFADIGELLQHAEFNVVGNVTQGRAGVEGFLEAGIQRHADGTPRTWHTVTNTLIEVAPFGSEASSESYYTVFQQLDGFPLQVIVTGKYLDRFEHRDGAWRFARRTVTAHSFGDVRHHVKGPNTDAVESRA